MEEVKKKKLPKKWLLIGGAVFLVLVLVAAVLFTPLGGGVLRLAAAPTVTLEIVEGPELDEESGMYRILVQAVVTGRPVPTISFNRNDELGEVEGHLTVIYLAAGASFQLQVSVTSSAGTASATLDLTAPEDTASNGDDDNGNGNGDDNGDTGNGNGDDGDDNGDTGSDPPPPANRNPVIHSVSVSVDSIIAHEPVTFTVSASDPDGDPLTYHWIFMPIGETPMGTSPAEGATKQYTPDLATEWYLSLLVRDGRGGEATFYQTYIVTAVGLSGPVKAEWGWIEKDHWVTDDFLYIGDSIRNNIGRGFLSFDISDAPPGVVIYKVELRMANPLVYGNPSFMHSAPSQKAVGIEFYKDYWGERPIDLPDYNRPWLTRVATTTNYDITIVSVRGGSNPQMASALQISLNNEDPRFQLRVQFNHEVSNNNSGWDGVEWSIDDVYLKVWYYMPIPEYEEGDPN